MKLLKPLFVILLTLGCFSQGAMARQDRDSQPLDRTQAAARAQQHSKGRVLRVEQTKTKFRVKVLKKNGRVVMLDVDRETGQVQPTTNRDNQH